MAITGIVMMAYADGFHGDSFVGVALAVGSASTSALYKVRRNHSIPVQALVYVNMWMFLTQVLLKMFLGSANLGEVAHFLSTMGVFNLVFISGVPLILYFTKVEHWGSLSSLPWGYMCGLAGLWLGEGAHILQKITNYVFFPHLLCSYRRPLINHYFPVMKVNVLVFPVASSVQHPGPRWRGADISYSHLHRNTAQCSWQCRYGLSYGTDPYAPQSGPRTFH